MAIDEPSIKNSFRAVKGDILEIQGDLMNIKEQQAKMLVNLEKILAKIGEKKLVKKK